ANLLAGRAVEPSTPLFVSTGRDLVEAPENGALIGRLERANVTIVTDTCTYVSPIIETDGAVMTNSAKWAFYAPGNLGTRAVLASMRDCVESAVAGRIVRDDAWIP